MEIMKLTIKEDFHRGTCYLFSFSYHKITLFEKKYVIKDVYRRQKLRTDFSQTCCIDCSGCDCYNCAKNIIHIMFPSGSNFRGLNNKIIGFIHIQ